MNKEKLVIFAFLAVLIGVVGGIALNDNRQDDLASQGATVVEDVVSEPAQTNVQEVSQAAIVAGSQAKQVEFEAQEPEYPDAERILYEVQSDGSTIPELHPADAQLWDLVQTLAPTEEVFDSIVIFEVYFDEDDTTLASVEPQDDTNSTWLFSINYIAVTDFEELVPTLVHEFAHILTLADSQTTTQAEDVTITETCEQYLVIEGCLNPNSFLNQFFNEFWRDSEAFIGDQDRTEDKADAYFAANPNDFVSAYATTNAVEDFAESFMVYAIQDRPQEGTVKALKTSFFDQFEELSQYRTNVRQAISAWAN